ncbi:MAG TPA: NrfD/PsrC family molybdoenzyme membrane anchor subunit [Candidatus Limnocylindria bacterium]|nr:NrfD/PsrC family molybdoenzyme membrane anchor subunit [Candidatus Limnocylindria bacterium]
MRPLPDGAARTLERAWAGWRPDRHSHGNLGRPFDFSFPVQQHWGAKVAFYLYLGGTGAGFVFVELLLRWWGIIDARTAAIGMWIGLALAVLSALAIFDHLGPVSRWSAYFAFRRIRTSWISRGVTMLVALLVLRLVLAVPSLPGLDALPWTEGTALGDALRALVLVVALAFMVYTGLVISSWNAIAFWNTPLLPVLFTAFSLLGGLAALPAIAWLASGALAMEAVGAAVWPAVLALLAADAILLGLYVYGMSTATPPARASVAMLVRGPLRPRFVTGVVTFGLLIPAAIGGLWMLGALAGGGLGGVALLGAIAAIEIGGYFLRDAVLRAGVYGPPV